MKKLMFYVCLLALSASFTACQNLKGPEGPQGIKGDQGSQGSITFYSTPWLRINSTTYAENFTNRDGNSFTWAYLEGGLIETYITQKIIDEGMIIVYNRMPDLPEYAIRAMPFTAFFGDIGLSYSFQIHVGIVFTLISYSKVIDPKEYISDEEYRIIIVPPATGARMQNINWKDYNAVKTLLGLSD